MLKSLKSLAGIAIAAVALASPAVAQETNTWPSRPVTLVVPYAAGGPVDTIARIIAARLSELLGQQMVIENVGGAGGMTGTARVAKAAPDGYTVLLSGSAVLSQNPSFRKQSPYDPIADFAHVALFSDSARVLIARKDFPPNDFKEFLAYVKANQGTLQYGSPGAGSGGHTCAILLDGAIGAKITHVPYRGAGPAIADVIGGQVPYILSTLTGLLPHIKAGKLKPIALTSPERSPLLPNVPTIAESGFPGYDMDTWIGTFVPRATPAAVVKVLHEATLEALKSPAVRDRIESQAGRIIGGSSEQLDAIVADDIKRYTKIVRDAKIKAE